MTLSPIRVAPSVLSALFRLARLSFLSSLLPVKAGESQDLTLLAYAIRSLKQQDRRCEVLQAGGSILALGFYPFLPAPTSNNMIPLDPSSMDIPVGSVLKGPLVVAAHPTKFFLNLLKNLPHLACAGIVIGELTFPVAVSDG